MKFKLTVAALAAVLIAVVEGEADRFRVLQRFRHEQDAERYARRVITGRSLDADTAEPW